MRSPAPCRRCIGRLYYDRRRCPACLGSECAVDETPAPIEMHPNPRLRTGTALAGEIHDAR